MELHSFEQGKKNYVEVTRSLPRRVSLCKRFKAGFNNGYNALKIKVQ